MINKDLLQIEKENTFSRSSNAAKEYIKNHPDKEVISLGIGDVSMPIVKPIIEAMHKAVDDLATMEHFQGYGAYYGIEELRKTIIENDYKDFGFELDEVYVGDGTKTDSGSILELFDKDAKVLVSDPVYPIYENSAYALSRKIYKLDTDDNFKMVVPKEHYDIIYICSPSNPTGVVYTKKELKEWIDYAIANNSIIIYDNVYKDFIRSNNIPESIYEVEGSKRCCIEMRSFSKAASFTGLRCSYFILPKEIGKDLIPLWKERTLNRFNGASYVAQKAAIASYLDESKKLRKEAIKYYQDNADYLRENLEELGFEIVGGYDAPYLWIKCKDNKNSWEYFDFLLKELNIITVPGIVFGKKGDGWFRVSALGSKENSIKAIKRFRNYYEKNI